ncbi:hypothetical protein [Kineobactrum salinum]|uniref:Uncharacterized protein n=1 Tax=Kineobactrum salinum TaxID=2708301 RepID=A0A6C0TZA4_9GAMM|nr:hypothetical protein [Kineobactrum salinum]QIB64699.1 hypothetical protein G3T16_04145 [Kineobactrum salinum]
MTVKKLLVSGGCLRPNGFELGEGKYYDRASLVLLDLQRGEFTEILSKSDGGANYPAEHPNQQYTAACLDGDILWLPTDTEILQYRLPELELLSCYSHPCFHNIHSVQVVGDELAVTSTGLDNVVLLDRATGAINRIINTQGLDPWHRFDAATDYRLVHSTRPHDSHPNYVFQLDGKLWVTRCSTEDAVCLEDVEQRIDLGEGEDISAHDGLWWGETLVFTRVDGMLILCDPVRKKVIENHDPFRLHRNRPKGWCRGLHIDGDMFYIGYSRLRKTNLKSKLRFLSQGNFKYGSGNNSLVVAYNMKQQKVDRVYESPEGMVDAIYGILPYTWD